MYKNQQLENLKLISHQVEQLYLEATLDTDKYAHSAQLKCPPGCGKCCNTPKIHVTVLECLPTAFDLLLKNESIGVLEKLNSESEKRCYFFVDNGGNNGRCTNYNKRFMICRLFGYSAVRNKNGEIEVAHCQVHKDLDETPSATTEDGTKAPLYIDYTNKLQSIDPNLSRDLLPVRLALKTALLKIAYLASAND